MITTPEKLDDFVVIGNKQVEIALRYKNVMKYRGRYNALVDIDRKLRERGKYYNWDYFIFWCLWKVVLKKGFWPFRKPFRSLRHMMKEVRWDEFQNLFEFISVRVVGNQPMKKTEETEEKKNLKVS